MEQPASGLVHATTPKKIGAITPPVSALLFARSSLNPEGPPDLHIIPSHSALLEGTTPAPGTISLAVVRPEDDARGRLSLVSRDPLMPPKIELGLCSTQRISRSSPIA
jgi:hypothetical protein